jgi:hypothetical protein
MVAKVTRRSTDSTFVLLFLWNNASEGQMDQQRSEELSHGQRSPKQDSYLLMELGRGPRETG